MDTATTVDKGALTITTRVHVTKDRYGSGKLTVKLPWEVAGSQAVKRYSMMDLE